MNTVTAEDICDLSRWHQVITPGAVFHVAEHEPIRVTLEQVLAMDDATRRLIIRHNDHVRRTVDR